MTDDERVETLLRRKQMRRPWHCPPHRECEGIRRYIVSAACYEHQPILAAAPHRMQEIAELLRVICTGLESRLCAWCVLPNHYHLLVETEAALLFVKELGNMHGRTARQWNSEDGTGGRKVWFNCVERLIRSEGHYWASINYIHHNPVRHGYTEKWTDWPFSSAAAYLEEMGKEKATQIWKQYPILDYGEKWDV